MEIINTSKGILLSHVKNFQLEHTFLCGQCFRWNLIEPHRYIGIAQGNVLDICEQEDGFLLRNTSLELWEKFWKSYFSFDIDYNQIKQKLRQDAVLKQAMQYGYGIRILRQDFFETIVSFLISQSNNIPRIKSIIETLCRCFGKKITYRTNTYYTFPTLEDMAGIAPQDLAPLRVGYRDRYICQTVNLLAENPSFLTDIVQADTKTAKEQLLSLCGVGDKVANCILLFGLSRFEAFPIDVWVRRIMEHYYFHDRKTSLNSIAKFAQEQYGEYGGYAQQYLFYYARENAI